MLAILVDSRLYSTMPASRRIRQLRRSKQGRASGPVKPVHGDPNRFSLSATSDPIASAPKPMASDTSDVLRTDESELNRFVYLTLMLL